MSPPHPPPALLHSSVRDSRFTAATPARSYYISITNAGANACDFSMRLDTTA